MIIKQVCTTQDEKKNAITLTIPDMLMMKTGKLVAYCPVTNYSFQ